jgi:hypothetical protein
MVVFLPQPSSPALRPDRPAARSAGRVEVWNWILLTINHASHDTTTKSAFNPSQAIDTKLAHLATLLIRVGSELG